MTEALVPTSTDLARTVHETTKTRALEAHSAVMDRLISVLHGEDDKAALTAAGMILRIGGAMKAPAVKVNFTFNELQAQSALSAGPLAGITQIVESAVIDVDDDGDSDDNE